MPESTQVPENAPLMLAWKKYRASPEFTNSLKWAQQAEHTEGSLWAAFVEGWMTALGFAPTMRAGNPNINQHSPRSKV